MASEASPFFAAEEKHQDYLTKNPNGYCNHRIRIASWPGP
jgi:peptide methionine sulfoxide reductase MsrA